MTTQTAAARLRELAQHDDVDTDELDAIWAALPTVDASEILGSWKGTALRTGHPMVPALEAARWHGKRFGSLTDVQPNMCRGDDGELYSNKEIGRGEASLWNVEFRGEVTATMVYDGMPVLDHFKRADDGLLLGVMNGKQIERFGGLAWFLLERE